MALTGYTVALDERCRCIPFFLRGPDQLLQICKCGRLCLETEWSIRIHAFWLRPNITLADVATNRLSQLARIIRPNLVDTVDIDDVDR